MFTISGKVLDENGFAIENATVTIAEKFALSDEMGNFTIECVRPGSHFLTAVQRGFDYSPTKLMITRNIPDMIITMNTSKGISATS